MHIVVEPRDTVRIYHTGLMILTVHALGVLIYRWYLLFFIPLCPPCLRGRRQFPLLEQILCLCCALRFLGSFDIMLFLDYARTTDGWTARDISKGSWVIPLSISPGDGLGQALFVMSP
jgi:hypothetical protein